MSSSPPGNTSFGARYSGRSSARGSQSSGTNSRETHSFIKRVIGQRSQDYHGAPSATEGNQLRRKPTVSATAAHSPNHSSTRPQQQQHPNQILETDHPSHSFWVKLVNQKHRRDMFRSILNNSVWKFSLICFAFILLFASQVQQLFIPAEGDTAMNVLYIVVFVFFAIDILIRCDAEDKYFSCSNKCRCCSCGFGSFLFWCDFISTLTLLHDISWVNKNYFAEQKYDIELGMFGIPINGLEEVNSPQPVEWNQTLLVTIAQTARVARFIRSSQAVKISSKVNWYFLLNLLNPFWWIEKLRRTLRRRNGPNKNSDRSTDAGSSAGDRSREFVRRVTWGVLGLGAVAVVKANAASDSQRGVRGVVNRIRRLLGFTAFDTEDFRRHMAAVRIQRAWRNAMTQRHSADDYQLSSEFADFRMSGSHLLERDSTKRSFAVSMRNMGKKSSMRNIDRSTIKPPSSILQNTPENPKRRSESQVGSAMRELTGQRVAMGIIIALLFTGIFSYVERDATRAATMIVLHNQTGNSLFANKSLTAARSSSVPDLFLYTFANGETREYDVTEGGKDPDSLRARERLRITITDYRNQTTIGLFSFRDERREEALVSILSTIFILLVWFFGVIAFAGPVMVLVVIPIERMVRLLDMLMQNPLGYQGTSRYKRFVAEENEITKNTRWTKEILEGMETSFLMSTILRIGSLMKVGFGSAGVEIIRNNLEKSQSDNTLLLSSQAGSTVSCIFLFCDIRNFTDATECLQEEVFVFTNRIAAVVHSNCHAYGGSANKNVGDAFLLSWRLEENHSNTGHDIISGGRKNDGFTAKNNQADKALLSVVKICIALHYEYFYIESMSIGARDALIAKLKNRKGPLVQMGFGLHAGRAVQGAIGSQRKIDATYVSESVERAEFLESSTKKYGLKMLMSDSFYSLLSSVNRRRCRKVDQIVIQEDEEDDDEGRYEIELEEDKIIDLYTFDMDIDALFADKKHHTARSEIGRDSDNMSESGSKRGALAKKGMRLSVRISKGGSQLEADEISQSGFFNAAGNIGNQTETEEGDGGQPMKLVLPSGPALYNANVWTSDDMRTIRQLYSDGIFFQKFDQGLRSFYKKDWDHARQCFSVILERFEDGPSRYFMNQIEKHNGKPPRNFLGYGLA